MSFTQAAKSFLSQGVTSSFKLGYPLDILAGSSFGNHALARLKAVTAPALVDDRFISLNRSGNTESFLKTSTKSVGAWLDGEIVVRARRVPAYNCSTRV